MFPTDPEQISGLPNEEKSIALGSIVGVSTVILGTSLLKISPLSSGVLGGIGGLLMRRGAEAMQERVKMGHRYGLNKSKGKN